MVGKILKYLVIAVGCFIVLLVVLKLLISAKGRPIPPLAHLTEDTRTTLLSYLQQSGLTPEEYIITKFRRYDVIMLGEFHRVQHDPLFVQRLIPVLYRNGIRLLGFEFACHEDQSRLDRLLNSQEYDDTLAVSILRNLDCGIWPYQEYLDIFRAAWSLNASLPSDSERFRILPMTAYLDGEKLKHGTSAERMDQERRVGATDSLIAEIVQHEALEKGKKILVYCGIHHAFSKFRQPMFDEETSTFLGRYFETRGGQRIYQKYPERVITVKLHSPYWYPKLQTYGLPFGGIVDQAFQSYRQPVGFDISRSPFADLRDSTSIYALGHGSIAFSDYCDGYIILDQIKNFRSATVIPTWFDGVSIADFKSHLPKELPFFVSHPRILLWLIDDTPAKNFYKLERELEPCERR